MLTAPKVLDHYYLEARCMLLEIAAMLDRYDRAAEQAGSSANGNGNPDINNKNKASREPRLELLYQALQLLAERSGDNNRAERLLHLFSDPS